MCQSRPIATNAYQNKQSTNLLDAIYMVLFAKCGFMRPHLAARRRKPVFGEARGQLGSCELSGEAGTYGYRGCKVRHWQPNHAMGLEWNLGIHGAYKWHWQGKLRLLHIHSSMPLGGGTLRLFRSVRLSVQPEATLEIIR